MIPQWKCPDCATREYKEKQKEKQKTPVSKEEHDTLIVDQILSEIGGVQEKYGDRQDLFLRAIKYFIKTKKAKNETV